jgi:hypothetical protein
MADNFANHAEGFSAPFRNAEVITKSDETNLDQTTRAIYVGGTGHISVEMAGGGTVLFSAIPAGTILPIRVTRVNSTDTTATLMVALW